MGDMFFDIHSDLDKHQNRQENIYAQNMKNMNIFSHVQ